jgi:hypothetical protein
MVGSFSKMSSGSQSQARNVPQPKIIGNSTAAFGQGLARLRCFSELASRSSHLCRKACCSNLVCMYLWRSSSQLALDKSSSELRDVPDNPLIIDRIDIYLSRRVLQVTQPVADPDATRQLQATSGVPDLGKYAMIARGTGNGKTSSTKPHCVPSRIEDEARVTAQSRTWHLVLLLRTRPWCLVGLELYLTCGSSGSWSLALWRVLSAGPSVLWLR